LWQNLLYEGSFSEGQYFHEWSDASGRYILINNKSDGMKNYNITTDSANINGILHKNGNIVSGGDNITLAVKPQSIMMVLLTNQLQFGLYDGNINTRYAKSGDYTVKIPPSGEQLKLIAGVYKNNNGADSLECILYAGDFYLEREIIIPEKFGKDYKIKLFCWYGYNNKPYTERVMLFN